MQLALSVRGLNKTYHSGPRSRSMAIPALRDISLDVDAGEIVGLVGRPGAGKSTLLLCLAGLLRPDEGSITWFGEQVTGHHVPAGLAYVPQRAGYYSFLTVREALEYYATLHDLSSANRTAQVESALREVCLHVHATRRVSSLSPSLIQRLGLAQSLIEDSSSTETSSLYSLVSPGAASPSFSPRPIPLSCIKSPRGSSIS
ncbi:MAG: hypothetical protein DMD63_06245 [Gemmatimonadetes bacterium]|nr:MAG: hypothetical protein DMD63_06245 [Gemmatimonadota bacterium]